ncbi:UFL1-like protein [Mya arenaria]|uniref:UFL1-like protein n=1 Tax=Mya arenaria TaxID=6604 RepID=A0ABY7ECV4_MYAAR|nr:UFL1-like protein [Mya arenaria]
MASWDDILKLQADLKAAHESTTKQKLSERNVIEIVTGLIEKGLLEVIYTVDGKEYITPNELAKEIKDELIVHGDKHMTLVLGQLIDRSYLDRLAEEVNDKLQERGHVTIPELTKLYDLPADFLAKNLHSRLGTIVKGQVDSYDKDVIFTDAFIARMRSQIRGAFSAVTRPIQIGTLIQQYRFQERIFFSILEELVGTGRLAGTISGGRQDKATYIPDVYTRSQNDWVDSFYKQNGYLEYDAMRRLGISDPKEFIRKRFKSESPVHLTSCSVGRGILDQVEASVEEALTDGLWVDIMPLLPSIFSPKDANTLLTSCLKKHSGAIVCCDTIVASDKIISQCSKPFPKLMAIKAEKDAKSHPVFKVGQERAGEGSKDGGQTKEDRKDQRRKKAAGGSGSTKSLTGTQGREVKTKSLKKKSHRGRDEQDSDEEEVMSKPKSRSQEIEFMSMEEIEEVLRKDDSLEDCPPELISEIAQQLIRPLTKQYQDVAKSIFLQASGTESTSARKKTHGELQEKLTGLWTNARLFEKGLKHLPEDVQLNSVRHLLRTVCTDITNLVLNAIATDHMLSVADESTLTNESRVKLITKLSDNIQADMSKLNASLNGKSLDDFFNQLDVLCGPANLGIMLKKPDKKKERQLTFSHRQALCEQLTTEKDGAMSLHLACVILFHKFTSCIVHVPGKCVPQLLLFLKDHLEPEKFQEMTALQDLIIAQLQRQQSGDSDEDKSVPTMTENIEKVKVIAMETKKSIQNGAAAAAED